MNLEDVQRVSIAVIRECGYQPCGVPELTGRTWMVQYRASEGGIQNVFVNDDVVAVFKNDLRAGIRSLERS